MREEGRLGRVVAQLGGCGRSARVGRAGCLIMGQLQTLGLVPAGVAFAAVEG